MMLQSRGSGVFGLSCCGSWASSSLNSHRARWLSCSLAGGIFHAQGSNICLLHWQADSFPRVTREALFLHSL